MIHCLCAKERRISRVPLYPKINFSIHFYLRYAQTKSRRKKPRRLVEFEIQKVPLAILVRKEASKWLQDEIK